VDWLWSEDVLYFEYTPMTVEYDLALDAFTVARADIQASPPRRRLSLVVVVGNRAISVEHLTLEAAIAEGRRVLERVIAEHRGDITRLTTDAAYVFDLAGRRLR
jgi:hypothetical protein